MIEKLIQLEIHSMNKFNNQYNRFAYSSYKKKCAHIIGLYFPCVERSRMLKKVTITRLYGKGKRELDYGNMVGGCKPILDILKKLGYIWDDSPMFIKEKYLQAKNIYSDSSDTIIKIENEN